MPRPLKLSFEVLLSVGWLLPAWLGLRSCMELFGRGTRVTEVEMLESLAFVRLCGHVALTWLTLACVYAAITALVDWRAAQQRHAAAGPVSADIRPRERRESRWLDMRWTPF